MIPHNRPTLGTEEETAALRVLRSGNISQGEEVELFENEFCEFVGLPRSYAVAVNNGTAALYLSLWALNGSEKVISFPGYVCSALRHAVGMIRSTEKLVDNDENSPNIDINNINRNNADITIIPHMFGIPINLTNLKIPNVIEDCAQSLGAKVSGKSVGLQADIGIFSFYATKLMTSGGEGGMLVSKNKELIDNVRDFLEFDYRKDQKKRFNFHMTDLHAAIGREQLKKLPNFLSRREEIFQRYKKEDLELLDIGPEQKELSPVRYRAILRTKNPKDIINSLTDKGVKAIIPIEEWEILDNPTKFPNAWKLSKETVSLPIYPSLTNHDVDIILSGIVHK